MAWLANIFSWIANSKPAQWALAIIGAILAFKAVQMKARMDGEAHEKLKNKVESAKQEARVSETRREIEEQRNVDMEEAREAARDLPEFSGPGELRNKRPDIAAELFGDREGGDGQATRR